jgi:hypothetical protein
MNLSPSTVTVDPSRRFETWTVWQARKVDERYSRTRLSALPSAFPQVHSPTRFGKSAHVLHRAFSDLDRTRLRQLSVPDKPNRATVTHPILATSWTR